MSAHRLRGCRGSASLFVVTAALMLTAVALLVMAAMTIMATQTRVSQAADLAALAGAEAVFSTSEPCAQSARIANANQSQLESCDIRALDVQVAVSAVPPVPGGRHLIVRATARAGPPDDP